MWHAKSGTTLTHVYIKVEQIELYKLNQVEVVVFPLQVKLSMLEAIYTFSEAAPFVP